MLSTERRFSKPGASVEQLPPARRLAQHARASGWLSMAHRFVGTTAIVRLEPKMPLRAIIPECSDEDDKLEASFVSNSVVSDIGRLQDR